MTMTTFFNRLCFACLALAALAVLETAAFGQDRSRDERDRGDRDPSDFLRRSDANNNGLLEPEEIRFGRDFVYRAAEQAGLDRSKPLPIDKLSEAMRASRNDDRRGEERRSDDRRDDDRRRDERRGDERRDSSSSRSSGSSSATIPGFSGTEKDPPKAPGFNVPLEVPGGKLEDRYDRRVIDQVERDTLRRYDRNQDGFLSFEEGRGNEWKPPLEEGDLDKDGRLSRFELYERYAKKMNLPPKGGVVYSTAASSRSSTDSSRSASDYAKVAEYAKGLLNRYDENKSGMLERDEWKEMKSEHHAADTDKDGVITLPELTVKLSNFGSSPSTGSASSSSSTPSPIGSGPSERRGYGYRDGGRYGERGERSEKGDPKTTKKSYRTPTATERLPKGLPDWFARNDANADGQVMMAEYMTSLTEQLAADFAKYDLNSDGVITPEECLEVEKNKKK